MSIRAFQWRSGHLAVLDQRLLPHKIHYMACRTPEEIAEAIRNMSVRGAPAIGCVAAYGMVLAAEKSGADLQRAARLLKAARPTAVNLSWAVDRMLRNSALLKEAHLIAQEDVAVNKAMGRHGAALLKKNSIVLTHCNTGALATAGHGTALGIIREAWKQGNIKKVFVDETRPYLQGARLTAWELVQEKIPHELIADNMAGYFMSKEKISAVIVGCDRVAANGDAANKIGTYSLAVLAQYHGIPFYVAMPSTTFDPSLKTGAQIPIEERSSDEVVQIAGKRIAPLQTKARHPAFDVTPASLITAIVTEYGVVRPQNLKNFVTGQVPRKEPSFRHAFGRNRGFDRSDSVDINDPGLRHAGMTARKPEQLQNFKNLESSPRRKPGSRSKTFILKTGLKTGFRLSPE